MPTLFLLVSLFGAALTLNAYRPLARRGSNAVVTFFAGWLVSELPVHHLLWQASFTLVFAWFGALAAWPGWVALAVNLVSWSVLASMVFDAQRSEAHIDAALRAGLGDDYRARTGDDWRDRDDPHLTLRRILRPFATAHPLVERIRNVRYAPHGRRGLLDIVRHKDARKGCPVLIQVHGGAWIIGSKDDQGIPLTNHMAAQGWVCVSINYRLSPRGTFPDHIIDVKRAIAWVKENIEQYGGDPLFIAITGGSAGGHLASLAALTANAPEYQPGFEDRDTSVQACVPFYGVYDWTNRAGTGHEGLLGLLERRVLKVSRQKNPDLYDRGSPMSRVHEDAPPFFVLHGSHDTLVPVVEAQQFVNLLRGISHAHVAYAELPGAQHAFEVFLSFRTAHAVRGVARFLSYVYSERNTRVSSTRPLEPRELVAAAK